MRGVARKNRRQPLDMLADRADRMLYRGDLGVALSAAQIVQLGEALPILLAAGVLF
jgi:hypothetical protein